MSSLLKLVMKGATGNFPLTLVTIREVLSDFEAREIRRNIELDRPQGRALVATKQTGKDDRRLPSRRHRAIATSAATPHVTRPIRTAWILPARGLIAMSSVVTVEALTGIVIAPSVTKPERTTFSRLRVAPLSPLPTPRPTRIST
eukprot:615069-Pleurochrysis_carterae.AAC.1